MFSFFSPEEKSIKKLEKDLIENKLIFNIDSSMFISRVGEIRRISQSESLPACERELIQNALITSSIKDLGEFFECFIKDKNSYKNRRANSHDAIGMGGELIEIKGSRGISSFFNESVDSTLFDLLNNTKKEFIGFKDVFNSNFDCNIQQVKITSFDKLNYSLYFKDVILEFEIDTNKIFAKNKKVSELIDCKTTKNVGDVLDGLKWNSSIEDVIKNYKLIIPDIDNDNILLLHKKLSFAKNLGYSDKQHRGNEGEGQFHINKRTFLFHLLHNFKAAHTYMDFKLSLEKKKLVEQISEPGRSQSFEI